MTKKIWFRRKRYGWGWVPASWEGWTSITIIIIAVLFVGRYLEDNASGEILAYLAMLAFFIVIIVGLGYMKGERPKWQWGKK